jgi:glycine betaine catabolism B
MASVKLALTKTDLAERKPVAVTANEKKVMLVMIDGKVYAMDGACSHRGGPLEKGVLTDYTIECPWHGALYDVRTGAGDPRTAWGPHQNTYKITEQNGELWIDI